MISNKNIGDQEVEYIYGMAFVENMVELRKRKDFTLYTPHPTQKLLISAITELEQLKTILTKRYEDAKKTAKKMETPKEEKTPELNELLPTGRKGIKCEELMKVLRLGKEALSKSNQFVLLIDIRPGAEFLDNRIKFDESFARKYEKPKITHIDGVKPGMIASKLTSSSKSKDGFNDRHRALMIVIYSSKSSSTDLHENANPVKIVYEALTKYDTPKCHSNVYVLEGGLYEWSGLYTHLTSNPTRPKTQFTDTTIIESAINADYKSAESILEKPKAPKVTPKVAPKPTAPPIQPIEQIETKKTTKIDDELARKEAQIAALNKQRAELELANAQKKKENAELDKKRFLFFEKE